MDRNEIANAQRVGERIRAEVGALIRSFPPEIRTIAAISQWLDVSFPVCQRLVRAARHKGEPLDVLRYLPGVTGLKQILAAARTRECDSPLVESAEAASRQYSELIDAHGGSQARLLKAIEATRGPDGVASHEPRGDLESVRRAAFESNRVITGREFETQLGVFIYRPDPKDPNAMDAVSAMGMIGIRRQPTSLPICPIQVFSPPKNATAPTPALPGRVIHDGMPLRVLENFSSEPLPSLVTRPEHGRILMLVDPDRATADPFDVMIGSHYAGVDHPRCLDMPVQHSTIVSRGPSRNLVLQVHLHRSMAQSSIAKIASYVLAGRGLIGGLVATPSGKLTAQTPEERWFDRLPDRPPLNDLGLGLDAVPTPSYERLPELVEFLFGTQGWSPNDFVGYRCELRYPLWGIQYMMTHDFSTGESVE